MKKSRINLSDLNGKNGFRLDGMMAGDFSGFPVSNAGDINGDGFDDVIVGALGANPNGGDEAGSSYVVYGKASGFGAALNLSNLNGKNGFRLDGAAFDYSGASVSTAGDINSDGFSDVIVGAPGHYPYQDSAGSSYVVFGKATGFDTTQNLSNLNGKNGFRLNGENVGDSLGNSVSNAGDINGDGIDDLIVGASHADTDIFGSGASYVVFGKTSGFESILNLSGINGDNGFQLIGGNRLGYSVSGAGDINGDGFDDLIIGNTKGSYGDYAGTCYVIFGKSSKFDALLNISSLNGDNGFRLSTSHYHSVLGDSVSSAGDVNGDGFDDLIVGDPYAYANGYYSGSSYVVFGKASGFSAEINLSNLNGKNGFRMDGTARGEQFGTSVSSAGDVNGDGFDDVIIGAPGASSNGILSGSSYVIYGKVSGFSPVLDLSGLDGRNGFRLDGVATGDHTGTSSTAGDVNGDGFSDLIIGAWAADPNGDGSGSSYIVFGGNFTHSVTFSGTPKADNLNQGTQAAERFVAGNGNDTMIGRGGTDVFHGGSGNDYIRIHDLNFRSIDGGNGKDTLGLGSNGMNLNLADVRGKISGIETIYLYGAGDNTLTVTALDLLNLSDTSNTLKVNGNAGDRVVGLGGRWEDGGIHGGFHTYTHGEGVLLVGVNVMTDFA